MRMEILQSSSERDSIPEKLSIVQQNQGCLTIEKNGYPIYIHIHTVPIMLY